MGVLLGFLLADPGSYDLQHQWDFALTSHSVNITTTTNLPTCNSIFKIKFTSLKIVVVFVCKNKCINTIRPSMRNISLQLQCADI